MIFNLITKAKDLFFNKTGTNLEADNVQDAITEMDQDINQLNQSLNNVGNNIIELGMFAGGGSTLDIEDIRQFRFIATQSEYWGTWTIGFFSPAALLSTEKNYGFNFVTNEGAVRSGKLKFNSNTNATIICDATTFLYGIK